MYTPFQADLWQGRVDSEEDRPAPRWHQVIKAYEDNAEDLQQAPVVLGFACDEGVRRNKGRAGAAEGPDALRRALAGLSWQPITYLGAELHDRLYDAGTVTCVSGDMEAAQLAYAQRLAHIVQKGGLPIGLGGGHEIAWASYSGLEAALRQQGKDVADLAVLNIDAHLDLRKPADQGSSGTPFRQIAEHREAHGWEVNYACLGVNPSANTRALFDFAADKDVYWRADLDCTELDLPAIDLALRDFLSDKSGLYLTICLDAISAPFAPGVSAPSALGLSPNVVLRIIHQLRQMCDELSVPLYLIDIAELNPSFDIDGRTAKLAARLIQACVE
ncbi:formimidoylglutamase [Pseudoteredinibacter isoporae]|uniref:formimidoylglutamase n=1 Tax=Pseudoteredinibacter isoporae TaxID=570281 RepID=UPI00310B58F4